jgi:hypothetical protein
MSHLALVQRVGRCERDRALGHKVKLAAEGKHLSCHHKSPRPLKIPAIRNNLEALALIQPGDGFPSPSQVPPNGTRSPGLPPSPGLLLLV